MINFFLDFLDLFKRAEDWSFFMLLSLIVAVPFLLGFLFSALHSKVRFKPLWLTLWIATSVAVLVGFGFLLSLVFEKGLRWDNFSWPTGMFTGLVLAVALFLFSSWMGRKFIPRKKKHWLLIPLILVGSIFCTWFFCWSSLLQSFGEVYYSNLTKLTLENSAGFDYEIATTGAVDSFDDGDDNRLLRIRVKGDSAYYQVIYAMCRYTNYSLKYNGVKQEWYVDGESSVGDSSQWILFDAEKTSAVKKLKRRIASYEKEFSTADILDGYCTEFTLDDFKAERRKAVIFCNADESRVRDAVAIEKLAEGLWPPRSSYVNLTRHEVLDKCDAERKRMHDLAKEKNVLSF